ncbi:MAG: pyrroline-5-carboxylate reductase [Betaproteobacteria bacterium]|nr:pyrroline-5-carboxylate reductase [Betaproteobacteria bacterium]
MKVGFAGGGNMASAMIGGLLAEGWSRDDLCAADVDENARARLEREFGIRTAASAAEVAAGVDCIVLAVKPQVLRVVAQEVAQAVGDRLVVSIAAGIRTTDLARWLGGHRRIVRVMPNTPALLRAGVSAAYAMPDVGADERASVGDLLGAVGKVLWVDSEPMLDGVTAVSGSGPAYVFYLIEAMQAAARELGFSEEDARLLSVETVLGAAKLAEASPETAATLRQRVTSRGGTTERALESLETHQVGAHLVQAILAAAERSRELGDALGQD